LLFWVSGGGGFYRSRVTSGIGFFVPGTKRSGRLCCSSRVGGSVWWQIVLDVRDGVGQVDSRWMLDNINRQVGDGESTLFWVNPWQEGKPLCSLFSRLYELTKFKLDMVAEMFERGWGVNGEAWKWRSKHFAWEEELLGECIICLTNFSFQVDHVDRWIWMLHDSNCYTVSSAY
jgi:hypothetical protein